MREGDVSRSSGRLASAVMLATLAVLAVLNSLVSVAYYLGVLIPMYMREGTQEFVPPLARPWLLGTILFAVGMTLLLGLDPSGAMRVAESAAASLRGASTTDTVEKWQLCLQLADGWGWNDWPA